MPRTHAIVGVIVGLIAGGLIQQHYSGGSSRRTAFVEHTRGRAVARHAPCVTSNNSASANADDTADEDFCAAFNALPKKYVAFEPWAAGWNNRRICIEHAAAMAVTSGRTLVLPPTTSYILEEHIGAIMLNVEDAYDMEKMRRHLNVVTWTEFMECGGRVRLLGAPLHPLKECNNDWGNKGDWYCHAMKVFRERAVMPPVDVGGTRISVPSDSMPEEPIVSQRPGRRRQIASLREDPVYDKETYILYQGALVCFANWLFINPTVNATEEVITDLQLKPTTRYATDHTLKQWIVGAIRDGLVYAPEVMRTADAAVAELGGVDGFSCVHLRRGDFSIQRPESFMEIGDLLHAYRDIFRENERVLVMTERDEPVKKELAEQQDKVPKVDVRFWTDLEAVKNSGLRRTLDPLACQATCVQSREFIAVAMSTYSGYIVKQRGFRDPPRMSYYLEIAKERHDPANPDAMKPGYVKGSSTWGHEPEVGWSDMQ